MHDDTPRALVCLIEGLSTVFRIIPTVGMNIMVLKDHIKENQKCSVPSNYLTIWKVDLPPSHPDERKDLIGKNVPNSVELKNEFDNVSDHWPATMPLNPCHIHIIVGISSDQTWPPTVLGKRVHSKDDNLSWLTEVHQIWNKANLRHLLFPKVVVNRADFDTLQRLLKELHPDRDSPAYKGDQSDVLNIKLDFLRSLPRAESSSLRHPEENVSRVDVDEEVLDSLFPSVLSFLDLSCLKLKTILPSHFTLALVREEYKVISDLIAGKAGKTPSNGSSVIISGQPGTGKTTYLYLKMIEYMIEGRQFLFQADNDTVYHVADNIEVITSWPAQNDPIDAFINIDENSVTPHNLLRHPFVRLIAAASPKGACLKMAKRLYATAYIKRLAIKLWSPKELFLTGIFLHPYDLSLKLLRESTSYFGCNPRQCFQSYSVENLETNMKTVEYAIKDAARRENILGLLLDTRSGGTKLGVSDAAYAIFHIYPPNTDTKRLLINSHFGPVSEWALYVLLKEYEVHDSNVTAKFYYEISGMPEAASLLDHLFKSQVLSHLCGIDTKSQFLIRRLTDSKPMSWTYNRPIRHFTFQESRILSEITKAVQNRDPLHLILLARNLLAVDSILYDPDDPDAVLTCIRITRNKEECPIDISGLEHIQSWLRRKISLEPLHPSKKRPWRFLFIVPSGMVDHFQLQRFESTGRGRGRGVGDCDWASNVQQCVLELEEQTIFGEQEALGFTTGRRGIFSGNPHPYP